MYKTLVGNACALAGQRADSRAIGVGKEGSQSKAKKEEEKRGRREARGALRCVSLAVSDRVSEDTLTCLDKFQVQVVDGRRFCWSRVRRSFRGAGKQIMT
jgi:hypothetical protein